MSRGGSGTQSSPLLPLLLPRPGPHNKAAVAAGRAAASAPRPRRLPSSRPASASPSRCRKAREPTARSLLRRAGDRPLPPPPALLSEGTGSWGRRRRCRRRHSSAPGGGEETGAGPAAGRGGGGGAMAAGAGLWARSPASGAPEESRTGHRPQKTRAPRPRPSSELHRPAAPARWHQKGPADQLTKREPVSLQGRLPMLDAHCAP